MGCTWRFAGALGAVTLVATLASCASTVTGRGSTQSSAAGSSSASPDFPQQSSPAPGASSASSSPAPGQATPSNPPNRFDGIKCAALTRMVLSPDQGASKVKNGPYPAGTEKRESIGGLIKETESGSGKPETSGTFTELEKDNKGKTLALPKAYACYDRVSNLNVSFSMEELDFFYSQVKLPAKLAYLADNFVGYRNMFKTHAPATILLVLSDGLTLKTIEANARLEQTGKIAQAQGTLFIQWDA